jgi:CheY-like chemotaxis protein
MSDDAAPYALVVDDEPLILMDACDILSDAGFRPLEAGDVDEAIQTLEAHAGDITLVFTDVQMPGERDGFDLAREVAERWPDIRTLVASGAAQPRDGDLPETAVFISKPFSADVVHERLQELLPHNQKPEPLKRAAHTK